MLFRSGHPDFVKILDFGVSKFNILNADEMSMTRTGAVMGTPYYMSPEQAKGSRAIDARSDLYSVGVIIYEALTGQVPFNADTFNELIFKIALEAPPPAESFVPNLDPAFAGIMRKAMAREPTERYQTADEMRAALLAWAGEVDAQAHAQAMGPALMGQGTMVMGPGAGPGGAAVAGRITGGTVAMSALPRGAHQATIAMPAGPPVSGEAHPKKQASGLPLGLLLICLVVGLSAAGGIGYFAYAQMGSTKGSPVPPTSGTSTHAPSSDKPLANQRSSDAPTAEATVPTPSATTAIATVDSPLIEVTADPTPGKWTPPRPPTATAPPTTPTTTPTAPKTSKPPRDITPEL